MPGTKNNGIGAKNIRKKIHNNIDNTGEFEEDLLDDLGEADCSSNTDYKDSYRCVQKTFYFSNKVFGVRKKERERARKGNGSERNWKKLKKGFFWTNS